jgi:hypothetical protein
MIGSGWWCTHDTPPVPGRPYHGSDVIRSAEFHHLWSAVLDALTSPKLVLLVDSASPVPPPITNPAYRTINLPRNPGHSSVHTGHYAGWTESVLYSLEYALAADIDYLVYVEQDVLLHGHGIIEHCIARMRKPLMFGSGAGTPQPLQQSLFIVRKDGMRRFLAGLHAINQPDKVIVPEWKFLMASLGMSGPVAEWMCSGEVRRARIFRVLGRVMQSIGFDVLPLGFGRRRPIDLNGHCYFQHATLAEVREYLQRLPASVAGAAAARSAVIAQLLARGPAAAEAPDRTREHTDSTQGQATDNAA